MKDVLTLIGIILVIVAYIKYIKDMLYGLTRPHLYSWIIFSTITFVVWLAQILNGAGHRSYITLVTFSITTAITLLAIKYGSKDIKKIDKILFVLALLSLIPWWLTKDATLSVILIVCVNTIAYISTIRKTLNNPKSESLFNI